MPLNLSWAESKLVDFIEVLKRSQMQWQIDLRGGIGHGPDWNLLESEIGHRLMTVMRIANRLEPGTSEGLNTLDGGYTWPHKSQLRSAELLLGVIRDEEEVAANLGLSGPSFAASALHPWIWNAAAGLWDDGHRRAAVQQAASAILDAHLPTKLRVEKGSRGAEPSSAFNTAPARLDQPRLRLRRFREGTQDWTNAHEGAMYLGMACQKLVRNLTSHDVAELDEQGALEQLAALSLFARQIDEAELEIAAT